MLPHCLGFNKFSLWEEQKIKLCNLQESLLRDLPCGIRIVFGFREEWQRISQMWSLNLWL